MKKTSIRQITRQYGIMLRNQKDDPRGINCYKCENCGHITKTIDVDRGVTPFLYDCENCGGLAQSSFGTDIAPKQNPTIEWYRPSLEETLKMRNKEFSDFDHVIQGGLIPRKLQDPNS